MKSFSEHTAYSTSTVCLCTVVSMLHCTSFSEAQLKDKTDNLKCTILA